MLEAVSIFLQNYGALLAILFSWLMVAWVYFSKRAAWRDKRFMRQVNFSLNILTGDNELQMWTLIETTADEVWQNEVAVETVLRAAERTTVAQPFMSFSDDEDMAYLLRVVLNKLSDKYSETFIAASLGKRVWTRKYVFGITCEKYGDTPTQKIRVMLVPESYLSLFLYPKENNIWVEVPSHRVRLSTLQKMAAIYSSNDPKTGRMLGTIELGLP